MTEKCASQFPVSIVTGVTADWRKRNKMGHSGISLSPWAAT
jgi:hypothetical protein